MATHARVAVVDVSGISITVNGTPVPVRSNWHVATCACGWTTKREDTATAANAALGAHVRQENKKFRTLKGARHGR